MFDAVQNRQETWACIAYGFSSGLSSKQYFKQIVLIAFFGIPAFYTHETTNRSHLKNVQIHDDCA